MNHYQFWHSFTALASTRYPLLIVEGNGSLVKLSTPPGIGAIKVQASSQRVDAFHVEGELVPVKGAENLLGYLEKRYPEEMGRCR